MARANPLDEGFGTPTQAAFGMHDRLAAECPTGAGNVPVHPAQDPKSRDNFGEISRKGSQRQSLNDGAPGNENSFGGSQYSGGYGGGYG